MKEKQWTMIWHQAMTRSFLKGRAFGKNKTVTFKVYAPVAGGKIRLRFSNRFGTAPYKVGAVTVSAGSNEKSITLNGHTSFLIPPGGITLSDPCMLPVRRGDEIAIRIFSTSFIEDSNMIEEWANILPGDHTALKDDEPLHRPLLAKALGVYNAVPAIEAAELLTDEPAKTIVAFGDSITALSRWTKPLAERLDGAYGGEYVLLNSGISGNCLLYEAEGIFGPVFGEMGTKRFKRDVMDIPGLHTVILALGVNDASYYSEETKNQINAEAFREAITGMTDTLHGRGVRVVMETITPRLGVARTMGKYTREMEEIRLSFNDWIRSADIFDYVFDAEAVVREERPDGFYYAEGLHQGDHLHPNITGGQKLADAFDLERLTGRGE